MKKIVSLSDNLRMLRESIGYSQEYVAIQMNITQQAYSNIEKKPENCSLEKLKKIASILQVPLVTLLNEDDTLVFQNFHQSGGNAATQMRIAPSEKESAAYQRLIDELKDQNTFLKKIIETKF